MLSGRPVANISMYRFLSFCTSARLQFFYESFWKISIASASGVTNVLTIQIRLCTDPNPQTHSRENRSPKERLAKRTVQKSCLKSLRIVTQLNFGFYLLQQALISCAEIYHISQRNQKFAVRALQIAAFQTLAKLFLGIVSILNCSNCSSCYSRSSQAVETALHFQ